MPFEIVRNDIINMQVDAIVNTANPKPIVGTGVDSAVHKKAGPQLLEARKHIGSIGFGEAVITLAYNLNAKYVIHTVGPIWVDGKHQEDFILSKCYRNALQLAKENGCESIAFPLIATGNYGFPGSLALQIAIKEISTFLLDNEMMIYLVVFDKKAFKLSGKLFKSVSSYISENYIHDKILDEYGNESIYFLRERRQFERNHETVMSSIAGGVFSDSDIMPLDKCTCKEDNWEDVLKRLDAGFSETLLKLIDNSGKSDAEIYKKANIDRKHFSKIRNNCNYKPSKTTAIAFAIALELDLEQTKDFIARAGYALSHSSKFDLIVEYFLVNKNYNVMELNEVLFMFDQPLIGS